jgi:general secretion pathway protein I
MTPKQRTGAGFSLVEVLVALVIVATALLAGLQTTSALTRYSERQMDRLVAKMCAQNAMASLRLNRQLPDVGDSKVTCEQIGRAVELRLLVQSTSSTSFRRIDVRVSRDGVQVMQVSTVIGRV